jgi:hypothetical protein
MIGIIRPRPPVLLIIILLLLSSSILSFQSPVIQRTQHVRSKSLVVLCEIQSSLVSVRDVPPEEQTPTMYYYHIDFKNFWKKTRAHFLPCDRPPRPPDYLSKKSWYWDVDDDHVIRSSTHWSNACGYIKDCFWTFDEDTFRAHASNAKQGVWLTGKCRYADFEKGSKSSMKLRVNDRKRERQTSSC